ncbi:hypothetical protein OGAPHI_006533 [Ogataea philodendri]|uniref:Uncharacterized protein n=1 Tax=Ogataea philodendri TaxID=1378263 RepID=A0A9P8T0E1_9ASCO|nr:uncharacterized protein OGAPHI_006533 [Ogataea philodendri]KAH3661683.1 hypothetical protein OGAPHI_006533 [Ogataea philodendri]
MELSFVNKPKSTLLSVISFNSDTSNSFNDVTSTNFWIPATKFSDDPLIINCIDCTMLRYCVSSSLLISWNMIDFVLMVNARNLTNSKLSNVMVNVFSMRPTLGVSISNRKILACFGGSWPSSLSSLITFLRRNFFPTSKRYRSCSAVRLVTVTSTVSLNPSTRSRSINDGSTSIVGVWLMILSNWRPISERSLRTAS